MMFMIMTINLLDENKTPVFMIGLIDARQKK